MVGRRAREQLSLRSVPESMMKKIVASGNEAPKTKGLDEINREGHQSSFTHSFTKF